MACKKCGLAMVLRDGKEDRTSQSGPEIEQMNGNEVTAQRKQQKGFIWSKIRVLKKVIFGLLNIDREINRPVKINYFHLIEHNIFHRTQLLQQKMSRPQIRPTEKPEQLLGAEFA